MSDIQTEIVKENMSKYPCQPSWDIIQSFLDELGMNVPRCERFYGIPNNVLKQTKYGKRKLPVKFWHIFYERIKTPYGVGFIKELEKIKKVQYEKKVVEKKPKEKVSFTHNRISEIK